MCIRDSSNGARKWYLNGKLHRKDGPAVEWNDGNKEWYINAVSYTHLRAHETVLDLVCRLLLANKKSHDIT